MYRGNTRSWLGVVTTLLLAPSVAVTACTSDPATGNIPDGGSSTPGDSGGGNSSPGSDAGSDASVVDAANDVDTPDAPSDAATTADASDAADSGPEVGDSGADSGVACSGVNVSGMVASFFTPQGQPTLPIAIQWNGCPQTAQAVSAAPFPTWSLAIGPSQSYFSVTTAGYYTTLSQYVTGTVAGLVPSVFLYAIKTLPGYNAAKGHVVVSLNAVKNTCVGGSKVGSTVVAMGHPEAVITYLDNNGNALGGGSMDIDARALISNLDPTVGGDVKPVISVGGNPACTIKTLLYADRAPVVANTVATFQAQAE